jgi:hypothetical protein
MELSASNILPSFVTVQTRVLQLKAGKHAKTHSCSEKQVHQGGVLRHSKYRNMWASQPFWSEVMFTDEPCSNSEQVRGFSAFGKLEEADFASTLMG